MICLVTLDYLYGFLGHILVRDHQYLSNLDSSLFRFTPVYTDLRGLPPS